METKKTDSLYKLLLAGFHVNISPSDSHKRARIEVYNLISKRGVIVDLKTEHLLTQHCALEHYLEAIVQKLIGET